MDRQKNDMEQKNKENYLDEIKNYIRNSNLKHSSRRSFILSLLLLTLFFASVKLIFSI